VTLKLENKKEIVAEVNAVAAKALSMVVAEYRGLTVPEMTQLRSDARKNGVYMRVVRNTLARLAVKGTDFEVMQDSLTGPLILAFSREEPGSAARLIKDFSKSHNNLVVRALSINGKVLPAKDIDVLATLPTREEALSRLLSVMQAPIAKFVRTVAAPKLKLVHALMAVRDQMQSS